MNNTGGEAMKKGATQHPAGTQAMGATGMPDPSAYVEDPRPNLFNIVKNIRENKVNIDKTYLLFLRLLI
jgi:hypothetical protein